MERVESSPETAQVGSVDEGLKRMQESRTAFHLHGGMLSGFFR